MGQDVLPGGVLVRGRHVIGHDVEHSPMPCAASAWCSAARSASVPSSGSSMVGSTTS